MTLGTALLIISLWPGGSNAGHQVVTVEAPSMLVCESMAKQALAKFGGRQYLVKAECLAVKL